MDRVPVMSIDRGLLVRVKSWQNCKISKSPKNLLIPIYNLRSFPTLTFLLYVFYDATQLFLPVETGKNFNFGFSLKRGSSLSLVAFSDWEFFQEILAPVSNVLRSKLCYFFSHTQNTILI